MNHKIKLVKLNGHEKLVPIDINIIDIVKWMDSLDSVVTLFSCEGGQDAGHPYVMFTCTNSDSLRAIIQKVQFQHGPKPNDLVCYGHIVIEAPSHIPDKFRYTLRFYSADQRRHFTNFLKTGKHYSVANV